MAVPGVEAGNPGDTMAVAVDKTITNSKGTVEAVTVEDIMERIPAPSYIIKTDIQNSDCKVIIILALDKYYEDIPLGNYDRRSPFIRKTHSLPVHGMGPFSGCLLLPVHQTQGSWIQGLYKHW